LRAQERRAGIQHGARVNMRLNYFESKGWGVVTEEDIPKDSFVCCYVGEIISQREMLRREDLQDHDGVTYMLNLIKGDKWTHMVVDGGNLGNIGRFFNHSCNPNLEPQLASIPCYDRGILCFFSKREIQKGEELVWSYWGGQKYNRYAKAGHGSVVCRCGSRNCNSRL